jgi:hypothetical protein
MSRARPALFAAAVLAVLGPSLVSAGAARAQAAAHLVGAELKDSKGKAVGRIERVIAGADGRPAQVLVRVDRVLRTLPTDALTPAGDGYASVLSRAEIAALPPSE